MSCHPWSKTPYGTVDSARAVIFTRAVVFCGSAGSPVANHNALVGVLK